MDFAYVDHEELGVTPDFINEVLDKWAEGETPEEPGPRYVKFMDWWTANSMPQGLQLVEMHYYPTMKEYVEKLLKERNINVELTNELLVQCALVIDSMIS